MASNRPKGSTSEVVLVNLGPGGVHEGALHGKTVVEPDREGHRGLAGRPRGEGYKSNHKVEAMTRSRPSRTLHTDILR